MSKKDVSGTKFGRGLQAGLEFFYFVAEFESYWVSYLPVKAGVRFSM